jgi:hypothetical protein
MDDRIDLIKKNAELVIEKLGPLSGIAFGLNRDSVEWVEGFIERQRSQPGFDPNNPGNLVSVLGSFLGECLIAKAGGVWHWSDEHADWSVHFGGNNHAFPFSKVLKMFLNGLEGGDSILGFYDIAVDYLAPGKLSDASKDPVDSPPN